MTKKGPGDLTPQEMAVWFAAWMDGQGVEFPEDIRIAARREAKKLAKVMGDFSVEDFFRFHIVGAKIHISHSSCWCAPTVEHVDSETGVSVLVHKDIH